MKKFLNIFLVFAMIFSMIFQYSGRASAAEYPNNVITGANITDLSNQPITGNNIGAWRPFRVNATYSLPNNAVHNGDKTILTLPVGFAPAAPFTFDVKAGDEVVAKGKLIDGSPVKLELTYTNYVDTHSGVSGTFFFNLQINSHTQPNTGNIPVTLTAQDGHVTNAGTVPFNPPTVAPQHLLKGGWMDSKDKSIGHYKISINQENKAMVGATLVDELKSPGVKYDKGSFTVSEVKWVVNPTQTDIIATEEVDVTSQFQSKMNIEDTRFTIAIGSRQAGKGLLVRYKTKISYEPVVGEEFKNSVELADNGQVTNRDLTYKILGAGGSSAGYVYKIKVNKTNENGGPLAGAKFSVVRDRNDIEAGTITTGPDGKGELGNLVKDKYRLVEVTAPQGYKKLTEPTIVEESDFSETDRTASKTITNVLETVDVTVTKAWVGPAKDSATVELKKEGENNALQTYDLKPGENWTHKFTNLRKYEPNGTLIKYTVKEKNIPQGYTSVVTGSVENGFTITNTNNEKVNVSVTKAWVGPKKASAKVVLKKVGDSSIIEEKVLNEAGSWTATFTPQPKYEANGTEIKYTVEEKDIPSGYTSDLAGTMASGFTITNTNNEKVDVSVTKVWVGPAKTSAKVVLKKVGNSAVIEEKELTAGGGWTTTFTGKPKYEADGTEIKYTVEEKDVPAGYTDVLTGTMANGFTITNTNTEKVNVSVTKAWVGPAKASAKVVLKKVGNPAVIEEKELNEAGSWRTTFTGKPKYEANGTEIKYTVEEKDVPQGYTANVSGTMASGFTITNTNTEKVNVSVEKKWIGSLKGSVVAQLKKEGSATVIQEKELNAAGLWKHTFTGLAKYEANGTLIKYEVVEKTVPQGYVVSYEKDPAGVLIIKNKQTKIDVKVTKKWKNVTGNNPKIKVQLLKNGQNEGAPIELPNGTTTHTWTNLDKANPQGNDYVYSVKEVGETANAIQLEGDQYKVTYEGNMKDGLTITNEKKPYNPGGGGGGGTPTPDPGVIGGGDRIETAIKISRRFYDKAKTVIVVRHDLFPDSMTASVLAKLKDAPILLNPTDKLDPRVGAEIKRLGAEEVIIVGGPDSVSERVREELKVYDKDKNVERVAGVDRYGTSEMVARRVTGITGKKYTGVVASGQVFPDALSVGTFASREAYPILLVKKDTVPYQIERAIKDLDISKTYIAGGTSTIFKSTEAKLPGVLERMAGKDRYETSVAIAKSKFKDSKEAFIASGEEFADALVISPISGKYNKPTLLASRNKNTNAVVKKYIQDVGLTSITGIGGEKYLPHSVLLDLVGK
ncbi:Cna B-type domain-containing protein [Peptostreptococcus stomatis]|uniref:Cna B-type domain-containing protein n=1 Tax=Peptostreptococcus stomatis TaxID=341694 RepID=UPI0028D3BADA|nr:Cna B-type domain-containing protein [Peptostreptococcus stomatis]